jgi:hypothetical protein
MTVAAKVLDLQLHIVVVRRADELDITFAMVTREDADALLVLEDSLLLSGLRSRIAELAAQHRLPTMYGWNIEGRGDRKIKRPLLPTASAHPAATLPAAARASGRPARPAAGEVERMCWQLTQCKNAGNFSSPRLLCDAAAGARACGC